MDEINALKNLLEQTDHIPNKLIEGLIDTLREAAPVTLLGDLIAYIKTVSDEYGGTIRQRAEWRKRINEISADEPVGGPEIIGDPMEDEKEDMI